MTGNVGTNGNIAEAKLGDLAVKYNTSSQGTGSVNNVLDVYLGYRVILERIC